MILDLHKYIISVLSHLHLFWFVFKGLVLLKRILSAFQPRKPYLQEYVAIKLFGTQVLSMRRMTEGFLDIRQVYAESSASSHAESLLCSYSDEAHAFVTHSESQAGRRPTTPQNCLGPLFGVGPQSSQNISLSSRSYNAAGGIDNANKGACESSGLRRRMAAQNSGDFSSPTSSVAAAPLSTVTTAPMPNTSARSAEERPGSVGSRTAASIAVLSTPRVALRFVVGRMSAFRRAYMYPSAGPRWGDDAQREGAKKDEIAESLPSDGLPEEKQAAPGQLSSDSHMCRTLDGEGINPCSFHSCASESICGQAERKANPLLERSEAKTQNVNGNRNGSLSSRRASATCSIAATSTSSAASLRGRAPPLLSLSLALQTTRGTSFDKAESISRLCTLYRTGDDRNGDAVLVWLTMPWDPPHTTSFACRLASAVGCHCAMVRVSNLKGTMPIAAAAAEVAEEVVSALSTIEHSWMILGGSEVAGTVALHAMSSVAFQGRPPVALILFDPFVGWRTVGGKRSPSSGPPPSGKQKQSDAEETHGDEREDYGANDEILVDRADPSLALALEETTIGALVTQFAMDVDKGCGGRVRRWFPSWLGTASSFISMHRSGSVDDTDAAAKAAAAFVPPVGEASPPRPPPIPKGSTVPVTPHEKITAISRPGFAPPLPPTAVQPSVLAPTSDAAVPEASGTDDNNVQRQQLPLMACPILVCADASSIWAHQLRDFQQCLSRTGIDIVLEEYVSSASSSLFSSSALEGRGDEDAQEDGNNNLDADDGDRRRRKHEEIRDGLLGFMEECEVWLESALTVGRFACGSSLYSRPTGLGVGGSVYNGSPHVFGVGGGVGSNSSTPIPASVGDLLSSSAVRSPPSHPGLNPWGWGTNTGLGTDNDFIAPPIQLRQKQKGKQFRSLAMAACARSAFSSAFSSRSATPTGSNAALSNSHVADGGKLAPLGPGRTCGSGLENIYERQHQQPQQNSLASRHSVSTESMPTFNHFSLPQQPCFAPSTRFNAVPVRHPLAVRPQPQSTNTNTCSRAPSPQKAATIIVGNGYGGTVATNAARRVVVQSDHYSTSLPHLPAYHSGGGEGSSQPKHVVPLPHLLDVNVFEEVCSEAGDDEDEEGDCGVVAELMRSSDTVAGLGDSSSREVDALYVSLGLSCDLREKTTKNQSTTGGNDDGPNPNLNRGVGSRRVSRTSSAAFLALSRELRTPVRGSEGQTPTQSKGSTVMRGPPTPNAPSSTRKVASAACTPVVCKSTKDLFSPIRCFSPRSSSSNEVDQHQNVSTTSDEAADQKHDRPPSPASPAEAVAAPAVTTRLQRTVSGRRAVATGSAPGSLVSTPRHSLINMRPLRTPRVSTTKRPDTVFY